MARPQLATTATKSTTKRPARQKTRSKMETSSELAGIAAQMTKVEAEIEKVDRQITKIENEIEKAENQADEARINGNENEWKRLEKKTDYLRDKEKQLRKRVNQSIPNESFIDQEQKQKAIARGEAFVKAILADMEEIEVTQTNQTTENEKSYEVSRMQVLRDVPMLETGAHLDIVVRTIIEPFWKACIEWVDTPNRKYRVCAIGTPGIGKTITTAVLIRLLLQQRRTVVYVVKRTAMKIGVMSSFRIQKEPRFPFECIR